MQQEKNKLSDHYAEEVQRIKSEIGDLETVRQRLNLSARKISQLLMVDPSAWSRWTKNEDQAPPHIWRSLNTHIKLLDLQNQAQISVGPEQLQALSKDSSTAKKEVDGLKVQIEQLQNAVKANRAAAILMGLSAVILCGAFLIVLSRLKN